MNEMIFELKVLADQIKQADQRMVEEIRENIQNNQEAMDRLHKALFLIPKKLVEIAETLEKLK